MVPCARVRGCIGRIAQSSLYTTLRLPAAKRGVHTVAGGRASGAVTTNNRP